MIIFPGIRKNPADLEHLVFTYTDEDGNPSTKLAIPVFARDPITAEWLESIFAQIHHPTCRNAGAKNSCECLPITSIHLAIVDGDSSIVLYEVENHIANIR